jgi:hypothetical protein
MDKQKNSQYGRYRRALRVIIVLFATLFVVVFGLPNLYLMLTYFDVPDDITISNYIGHTFVNEKNRKTFVLN